MQWFLPRDMLNDGRNYCREDSSYELECKILVMLLPLNSIAQVGISKCSMYIAMPQYGLNAPKIASFGDHESCT